MLSRLELGDRRDLLEEAQELRVLVDQRRGSARASARPAAPSRAAPRFGAPAVPAARRPAAPRTRLLQRAHRQLGVAVARGDRLALLGDAGSARARCPRAGPGSPGRCARRRATASRRGRGRARARARARAACPASRSCARCSAHWLAMKPGVLARVRVADHHHLAVAVRSAARRGRARRRTASAIVAGAPSRSAQRLEQRHDPQLRRALAGLQPRAPGEPQRGEHVGGPLDHRDHHRRHGAAAVGVARQRDRVEHAQRARPPARPGGRTSPLARARRSPPRAARSRAGSSARPRTRAAARRVASRTTPADWRMSRPARWNPKTSTCHSSRRIAPPRDVLGAEALAHELEVAPQLLRVGVAGLAAATRVERVARAGARRTRAWSAAAPTRGAGAAARGADGSSRCVALQRRAPAPADDRPRSGECEKRCASESHALAQQPQRGRAVQPQRARERLGPDLGMAVHVRARPRAERQRPAPRRRVPNARSTSPSTSGTASNRVASKKNRLRRTSSSTRGRTRRTSSVCHQIVRISRSSSSSARRRAWPMRGSSSRSSRSHQVGLVVEHGAPRGLGRVRGEHQLDVQRAQRLGGVRRPPARAARPSRRATRAARSPEASYWRRRRTRSRSSAMLASCSCSEQARMYGSTSSSPSPCRQSISAPRAFSSPPRNSAAVRWIHATRSANSLPCCSDSTASSARDRRSVSRATEAAAVVMPSIVTAPSPVSGLKWSGIPSTRATARCG